MSCLGIRLQTWALKASWLWTSRPTCPQVQLIFLMPTSRSWCQVVSVLFVCFFFRRPLFLTYFKHQFLEKVGTVKGICQLWCCQGDRGGVRGWSCHTPLTSSSNIYADSHPSRATFLWIFVRKKKKTGWHWKIKSVFLFVQFQLVFSLKSHCHLICSTRSCVWAKKKQVCNTRSSFILSHSQISLRWKALEMAVYLLVGFPITSLRGLWGRINEKYGI